MQYFADACYTALKDVYASDVSVAGLCEVKRLQNSSLGMDVASTGAYPQRPLYDLSTLRYLLVGCIANSLHLLSSAFFIV